MAYIDGSLDLRLSPYSLVISTFSDRLYPRQIVEFPSITFAQSGTPVLSGVEYDPKLIWDVTCILNETDANTLNAMHQYGYLNNSEVTIHDYTLEVVETTQSRNTAADASVTNDGTNDIYYARFRALFTSPLSMLKTGPNVRCQFILTETSKTAPP